MSIVLWWIMVLIVKRRITRRPVHHASRLSVHHVTHRRIRTIRPARSCGQWWKHYTLRRLDLCSVIGRWVLDKLADPFRSSRGELERELDGHSIYSLPLVASPRKETERGEIEAHRGREEVWRALYACVCVCVYECVYDVDSPKSRSR